MKEDAERGRGVRRTHVIPASPGQIAVVGWVADYGNASEPMLQDYPIIGWVYLDREDDELDLSAYPILPETVWSGAHVTIVLPDGSLCLPDMAMFEGRGEFKAWLSKLHSIGRNLRPADKGAK